MNALFVVSLCLIGMVASQDSQTTTQVAIPNVGTVPNADAACTGDQAEQGKKAINQMCSSIKGIQVPAIPSVPGMPKMESPEQIKTIQNCVFKRMTENSAQCFEAPGSSEQLTVQQLCDDSRAEQRSQIGCCYLKQTQASGGGGAPKMPDASSFTSGCVNPAGAAGK